jgi:hypothetical protein
MYLRAIGGLWAVCDRPVDTQVIHAVTASVRTSYATRGPVQARVRAVAAVGPPADAGTGARCEVTLLVRKQATTFGVKPRRAAAVPGSAGASLCQPMSTSTLCS